MNNKIFKTKDGRVSAYGFICGYIETFENENLSIRIHKENGCLSPYHVKAHDADNHLISWTSHETIPEAYKKFRHLEKGQQRTVHMLDVPPDRTYCGMTSSKMKELNHRSVGIHGVYDVTCKECKKALNLN